MKKQALIIALAATILLFIPSTAYASLFPDYTLPQNLPEGYLVDGIRPEDLLPAREAVLEYWNFAWKNGVGLLISVFAIIFLLRAFQALTGVNVESYYIDLNEPGQNSRYYKTPSEQRYEEILAEERAERAATAEQDRKERRAHRERYKAHKDLEREFWAKQEHYWAFQWGKNKKGNRGKEKIIDVEYTECDDD